MKSRGDSDLITARKIKLMTHDWWRPPFFPAKGIMVASDTLTEVQAEGKETEDHHSQPHTDDIIHAL